MMTQSAIDPKHWHDRAAEMRVLSDAVLDDQAKSSMLKLADDYDRLGDRAAKRLDDQRRKDQTSH
jgi:hypothetical protein